MSPKQRNRWFIRSYVEEVRMNRQQTHSDYGPTQMQEAREDYLLDRIATEMATRHEVTP